MRTCLRRSLVVLLGSATIGLVLAAGVFAGWALRDAYDRARTALLAPAAFVVGAIAQGAAAVAADSAEATFAAIEADQRVAERLGEPLQFPPLETIEWLAPLADEPARIPFRYVVTGPQGIATVEAEVVPTEAGAVIHRLEVSDAADNFLIVHPL